MATKFLRKIILEELQKVLKEADYPDIPGSEPGQMQSPYDKSEDRELDLGDTTFNVKRKSGKFDKRVYDLQNDLNATGKYNLVTDGVLGPETMKAVRKEVGWRGTPEDMLANVTKVRGMLQGAISTNLRNKIPPKDDMEYAKPKLAGDLAAANQARGSADIVLDTGELGAKPRGEASPPEPSSDEFTQRMLQGQRDLNRKMNEPPTKINAPKTSFKRQEESIAREIKKLLRSI